MCTVSWLPREDGYHLLCNRDEKRSRPLAKPPAMTVSGKVQVLAPLDGAPAGGTWISANNYGVSVCLLNGTMSATSASARPEGDPTPASSRGLVIRHLAASRCLDEIYQRLDRIDLSLTLPFTLVALQPGRPASIAEWNGSAKSVLPHGDSYSPLISSSFDPARVRRRRRHEFARHIGQRDAPDPQSLHKFHASHGPEPGPYSPCMHRDDAETVSFSWIRVAGTKVFFEYSSGSPCRTRRGQLHWITRL